MSFFPLVSTSVDTINDTEALETVTQISQDLFNSELAIPILSEYAKAFAMGFALATILILVTYGVFKALSLLHI